MPRKARVEFPGAVYHLLYRGDRREAIFLDERDREVFLATLGQVCERCRSDKFKHHGLPRFTL